LGVDELKAQRPTTLPPANFLDQQVSPFPNVNVPQALSIQQPVAQAHNETSSKQPRAASCNQVSQAPVDDIPVSLSQPKGETIERIREWCREIHDGEGTAVWSNGSEWDESVEEGTHVGNSANDVLFLAGCPDAHRLMRYRTQSTYI